MAWHKIGESYYNDAEARAIGQTWFDLLVDIGLPGLFTYWGVTWISTALEQHFHFFVVHTTTAKLIYIVAGLTVFCVTFSIRKLILRLGMLAFAGFILLAMGASFFSWLMH